ncbi:MAG: DUF5334 family protein [Desulfovibrionaceae bacterium]|nr:DUF5334 family protein [Desulfovibrionaceae bacterium]
MKKIFCLTACCIPLCTAGAAFAWEGFDAATTALVEVTPALLPARGDTVEVRDMETEDVTSCRVARVDHNTRTVELVLIAPDGTHRILVMEQP